ncbi:transcription antitermination factor NusB [Lichenihabitans psoromatis]|nr:transcription antitermination factor NusB [Lichenihabitans psoromatis]
MEVARKGLNEIFAEFESHWIGQEVEGDQYRPAEIAFFRNILQGVLDHQTAIDKMTDEALQAGWPLRRVEAVLRAILRCGTYELMRRGDVPARVVITEYADLAAAFFDREEVGLVNGVLDGLAHTLRSDEFEPRRQTPA